MMRLTQWMLVVLVTEAYSACMGCHSRDTKPDRVTEIEINLPLGVSAAEAIETMTERGYSCKIIENGQFSARYWDSEWHPDARIFEKMSFVSCARQRTESFVTTKEYVALVLDESNRVTDVLKRDDSTGL